MNTVTKLLTAIIVAGIAGLGIAIAVRAANTPTPTPTPDPTPTPTPTPVQSGKLAMIFYGWHDAVIDQQILAARPDILIDNTPGGYWHANCNPQTFQSHGIQVFSYIFSNYDNQPAALNETLIDAIAAEGTYGVFIDECNTIATTALASLCNYAHRRGLKVIVNPGFQPFNDSLYQIADYVLTDEHYAGRTPSSIESSHLSQTIVVGWNPVLTVQQAVQYTQEAWAFGFAYTWQEQEEYVNLPTWLSTYISLLG
jgi:hypothetical protein